MHLVVAMTDPTNLKVTDSLQFMTGCRIQPALAADDAIASAIEQYYGEEVDDQEALDFALEDIVAPIKTVAPVVPVPEPNSEPELKQPPAPDMGHYMAALKKLEVRYENLVRILLDRDLIGHKDLDELM